MAYASKYAICMGWLAAVALPAPGPALAQETGTGPDDTIMLDPITVTARRHDEDAQSVPISMNVIEGRAVDRISPSTSNTDIARMTPNFVTQEFGGPYTNIGHIRGVGSLFPLSPDDTSVSFNVDEIPMSAFGLPPSTLDLTRVEVLRGPQGTLYGRNSQGGAVNYIPNRPEFMRELRLRGEVGTNGWHLGEIVANTPLIDDVLAGRLALQYSNRDGDIRNVVQGGDDGEVTVGVARGSLLWTPTDDTSVLLVSPMTATTTPLPYGCCGTRAAIRAAVSTRATIFSASSMAPVSGSSTTSTVSASPRSRAFSRWTAGRSWIWPTA